MKRAVDRLFLMDTAIAGKKIMGKIVFAFLLLLAGLPTAATALSYNKENAAVFSLRIIPVLSCGGSQCRNEWNECFHPEPDSQGIVNIDIMPTVSCGGRENI
jgi:hypothetical protein